MEETLKLLTTYGFPMVFCVLFYVDLRKIVKSNTCAIKDLMQTQLTLINHLRDRTAGK